MERHILPYIGDVKLVDLTSGTVSYTHLDVYKRQGRTTLCQSHEAVRGDGRNPLAGI